MLKNKALILYSEAMGYTYACLKELINNFAIDVSIVVWDKKKLTPFEDIDISQINVYKRSSFENDKSLLDFCKVLNPDIVFVSGWMDKGYVMISKYFKKKGIKTVSFLDNQWQGSLRQIIGSVLSKYYLHNAFEYLWVSGMPQYEFAKKMGYEDDKIEWGFYSADSSLFSKVFGLRQKFIKQNGFQKSIVFVGRFTEVKNIEMLIFAFKQSNLLLYDWKLVLIGNGPLKEKCEHLVKENTKNIEIKDFIHPHILSEEIVKYGVFCLPSVSEPWGVVVHEFALAGFPLLVSNVCGAGVHFVKHGYNGFTFNPNKINDLVYLFNYLGTLSQKELIEMGIKSNILGNHINTSIWASTFMKFLNKN